jgi:tRNA A37 threonylcarbamoyladenosine dehydratase
VRPQLEPDAALKLDCGAGLGAATHVTGAFAFAAVGRAMELLLKPDKPNAALAQPAQADAEAD